VDCGKAFIIPCKHNSKNYNIEFEMLDQDIPNIMGSLHHLCKYINIVDKQNTPISNDTEIYEQYKDVFDGFGCITDILYYININPSYQPVIHSSCHVPVKLQSKIKEELKHMESLDVIRKVNTPQAGSIVW